jgi:hypothetical protein
MYFITTKNGIITGVHCGDLPQNNFFGTPYYGHEIVEVPKGAEIQTGDSLEFYNENWIRLSDVQLINAGLIPLPENYVIEGENIREMTENELIIAGKKDPPQGQKIEDGQIVDMTWEEKRDAELITEAQYLEIKTAFAESELNSRLAELQTEESKARAEIDEEYAAARKAKLIALLNVKQQANWPLAPVWPD